VNGRDNLFLILLLAGCADGSAAVLGQQRSTSRPLTGAWDLTLTLERPYPLGFVSPKARHLCGTIAFVAADAGRDDPVIQSDGVYHIALKQFGLDWLDNDAFPTAIARQRQAKAGSLAADSVAITLSQNSREHIELRGTYRDIGFDGVWAAQSARGTATGRFSLRPHGSSDKPRRCAETG